MRPFPEASGQDGGWAPRTPATTAAAACPASTASSTGTPDRQPASTPGGEGIPAAGGVPQLEGTGGTGTSHEPDRVTTRVGAAPACTSTSSGAHPGSSSVQPQHLRLARVAEQQVRLQRGQQPDVVVDAVPRDPRGRGDVRADRHAVLVRQRGRGGQRSRGAQQVVAVQVDDGGAGHPGRHDVGHLEPALAAVGEHRPLGVGVDQDRRQRRPAAAHHRELHPAVREPGQQPVGHRVGAGPDGQPCRHAQSSEPGRHVRRRAARRRRPDDPLLPADHQRPGQLEHLVGDELAHRHHRAGPRRARPHRPSLLSTRPSLPVDSRS